MAEKKVSYLDQYTHSVSLLDSYQEVNSQSVTANHPETLIIYFYPRRILRKLKKSMKTFSLVTLSTTDTGTNTLRCLPRVSKVIFVLQCF